MASNLTNIQSGSFDPAQRRTLQDLSRRIDEINRNLSALTTRVTALEPGAWTNLTLTNSWAAAAGLTPQMRKVGDRREFRGAATNSPASGASMFTLAAADRPPQNYRCASNTGGTFLNINVDATTGLVSLSAGTATSVWLTEINFSTAA